MRNKSRILDELSFVAGPLSLFVYFCFLSPLQLFAALFVA